MQHNHNISISNNKSMNWKLIDVLGKLVIWENIILEKGWGTLDGTFVEETHMERDIFRGEGTNHWGHHFKLKYIWWEILFWNLFLVFTLHPLHIYLVMINYLPHNRFAQYWQILYSFFLFCCYFILLKACENKSQNMRSL